jgi:DNA-binding XRE family transcriptional regulator
MESRVTPNLITRIGIALWGDHGWQGQMARQLDVDRRTIQRWKNGEYNPPIGVYSELKKIAAEKIQNIQQTLAEMRKTAS